jgi:hypothetical protein
MKCPNGFELPRNLSNEPEHSLTDYCEHTIAMYTVFVSKCITFASPYLKMSNVHNAVYGKMKIFLYILT